MRRSPRWMADSGVGYRSRNASAISRWTSGKMALAPGQKASRVAVSWLMAATRWRTSSPRARTTARSARVASENGVSVRSWWWRSRRYSAITLASPASDLAPETTSPSRQALMALERTGTTGWPASSSRSTSRPSGRSSATGSSAGAPSRRRRATRSSNPAAEWGIRKAPTVLPVWSSTQTACSVDAQSIPTNMSTTSWRLAGHLGEEDSAEWSLTGALGACLYCRSEVLERLERDGVLLALKKRPTLAGAPALTEPYNKDLRQPSSKQGWTSDRPVCPPDRCVAAPPAEAQGQRDLGAAGRRAWLDGHYQRVKVYVRENRARLTKTASEPVGFHRRFEVLPGAQAQVDWGDEGEIATATGPLRVSSFHMTLSYSRDPFCCFTAAQDLGTFWDCHRRGFAHFGGVPAVIVYDRTKTVVRRHVGRGQATRCTRRRSPSPATTTSRSGWPPLPSRDQGAGRAPG